MYSFEIAIIRKHNINILINTIKMNLRMVAIINNNTSRDKNINCYHLPTCDRVPVWSFHSHLEKNISIILISFIIIFGFPSSLYIIHEIILNVPASNCMLLKTKWLYCWYCTRLYFHIMMYLFQCILLLRYFSSLFKINFIVGSGVYSLMILINKLCRDNYLNTRRIIPAA